MGASATYGSSSSPLLSPPSGTGSVGAGLASSVLWRAPLLFNVANLLKYLEIWVDISHSSLVNTFVPWAVRMDLIRAATSSAVALFPVASPWRKTSCKNWRTLVVKWTDFLVFFSAQSMSAVGFRLAMGNWGGCRCGRMSCLHVTNRNWLARLCPLFLYHVVRGLSL